MLPPRKTRGRLSSIGRGWGEVTLPVWPLTINGKIDRGALPPPGDASLASAGFLPPATGSERRLARIFGDMLAHRVVEGGRQALDEGRRTLERAGGNLAEYLTEEDRDVVPKAELDAFHDDVDALRDDVERLAARMARLPRAGGRA